MRYTVRIDEEQDEFQTKIEARSASIYLVCLSVSLSLYLSVSVMSLASSCLKNSSGPLTAKDLPLFSPLHEPKLLICSTSVLPVSICLSVSGSLPFFLAIYLSFSASLPLSLSLSLSLPVSVPKQCNANQRKPTRAVANEELATHGR